MHVSQETWLIADDFGGIDNILDSEMMNVGKTNDVEKLRVQ